jgi:hypothetical protein
MAEEVDLDTNIKVSVFAAAAHCFMRACKMNIFILLNTDIEIRRLLLWATEVSAKPR